MYPEIRSQIPRSMGGFAPEPPAPAARSRHSGPGTPASGESGGRVSAMRSMAPGGLKTALYVLLACARRAAAQDIKPSPLVKAPMIQPPPAGQIEVLPIRGNLYALMGAGNNIVISVGADGVFIVDAGRATMTDALLETIRRVQREWTHPQRAAAGGLRRRGPIVGGGPRTSPRRRSRFATSSTRARIPTRSAATRSCGTPGAPTPAATSPTTSATRARAPPSWRTRTSRSA